MLSTIPYNTHTLGSAAKCLVPISYCLGLLAFAENKGLNRHQLLNNAGIDAALLDDIDDKINVAYFVALFNAALALSPDESVAYEMGLSTKLNAHGFLGYALMSAATVEEVIELVVRYYPTRSTLLHVSTAKDTTQSEPAMVCTVKENIDLGAGRQAFFNAITFELAEALHFLVGNRSVAVEIWLDYDEPPYFAIWQSRLPKTRFNMPSVQIRIPLDQLATPIALANPIAKKMAIAECEAVLQTQLQSASPKPISHMVLALLDETQGSYPNIDQVASRLNMSDRTLKRRLHAEGTNFLALLNQTRQRVANELLLHTTTPIELIALQLGYTDPANFTRAFKKWTGISPTVARNRAK